MTSTVKQAKTKSENSPKTSDNSSSASSVNHSAWASLVSKYKKKCKLTDWKSWQKHLAKRTSVDSLGDLVSGKKTSPLAWSLFADETIDQRTFDLIEELGQVASGKIKKSVDYSKLLTSWLSGHQKRIDEANFVFELLAITHALPKLSQSIDEELWWELLQVVYQHAQDASLATFDDSAPEQLIAGELPLTLAYQFPEIKQCADLRVNAADVLQEGLINLTDGAGLVANDHLNCFRPLLACWTRCLAIGRTYKKNFYGKEALSQYIWAVRQALRLTRYDGTQVMTSGLPSCFSKHLFNTALQLIDDDEDSQIAKFTLPHLKTKDKVDNWHLPEPGMESEWSRIGYLRSNWSQGSPKLTVSYPEDRLLVEVETAGEQIISGTWQPIVFVDGEELSSTADWEQVGWMSDADGDYLELELHLTQGCRLQRTFFLAREDGFLLVSDAVLSDKENSEIEYRCITPLVAGVDATAAAETREVTLKKNKVSALVLPIELPEWRVDPRGGELDCDEQELQLTQHTKGKALYAPLFFDLNQARKRKQFTWRQVTVAEKLDIQPRDVAVGYRVQVGKTNWAFYRSFTPLANRTIMGVNLTSECMIARLDEDGDAIKLLEVEHPYDDE